MALLTTASTPLSTPCSDPPPPRSQATTAATGFYANVTTAIVGSLNSSVGDVVLGRDAGGLAFGAGVTVGEEVGSNSTTPPPSPSPVLRPAVPERGRHAQCPRLHRGLRGQRAGGHRHRPAPAPCTPPPTATSSRSP